MNIAMPVDEAAFIALHIHTMKVKGGDLHKTVRLTAILKDMVQTIERFLNITIQEDDISYDRLITHLRFALTRTGDEFHTMDEEMLSMIRKKFSISYNCEQFVDLELSLKLGTD